MVDLAQSIMSTVLHTIESIYMRYFFKKKVSIIKDPHVLFLLLHRAVVAGTQGRTPPGSGTAIFLQLSGS